MYSPCHVVLVLLLKLLWCKLDWDISGQRYTGWYHILTGIEKHERNVTIRTLELDDCCLASKRDNDKLRVINYQFKAECKN